MFAVAKHRASRTSLWVRIALALGLLLPGALVTPASAVNSISVALLSDLKSGGSSSMWDEPVKAGTNYFFAATEGVSDTELWVSNGSAGNATKIDIRASGSSYARNLTPIPGTNSVIFMADDGNGMAADGSRRLFISDGTTTVPVRKPADAADTGAGFYPGSTPGLPFAGLVATTDYGVVFGAFYDKDGVLGDYLLYRITGSASSYTITELTYGFSYGDTCIGITCTAELSVVSAIGNTVYASLVETDNDQELYKLDLTAGSPSWAPVGSDLSSGANATAFAGPLGVAGSYLYFVAKPSGATSYDVYATDGSATPTPVTTRSSGGQPWTAGNAKAAIGNTMYFTLADDGDLYKSVEGATATKAYNCAGGAGVYDAEVLGSSVYFPCDPGDGGHLYKYDGSTSTRLDSGVAWDLWPSDLAAFDGSLYFAGYDSNDDVELFRYTGVDGDPAKVIDVASTGDSGVQRVAAAVDRLFFWASDSTNGLEPRIGTPLTARTLTVTPTGTGTVSSVPGGISSCASGGGDCTEVFGNGQSVTLTAVPGGSRVTNWVSGCDSNPTLNTCTVAMSAAKTVLVRFGYSLTLTVVDATGTTSDVDSTPTGISNCTVSSGTCTAVFAEPGNVTLTATPVGATVAWSNVICTGIGESATSNTCTFAMASPAPTPTVTFTAGGGGGGDTWDLTVAKDGSGSGTVTSNTGIRCGASCSSLALADETDVMLTAKAAKGSVFTGWGGVTCGEGVQTGSTCSFTLSNADETDVTATFKLLYKLTVTKSGDGSVTSSPAGIACGTACTASYADGTSVTLTAASAGTWEWTGCTSGGSPNGTCTVSMTQARNVTLTFTPPGGGTYYAVTISGARNGTVTSAPSGLSCGSICTWLFASTDTHIVLTATPNTGYTGVIWSGCPSVSMDGMTCTIDNIAQSYSIRVRFIR